MGKFDSELNHLLPTDNQILFGRKNGIEAFFYTELLC